MHRADDDRIPAHCHLFPLGRSGWVSAAPRVAGLVRPGRGRPPVIVGHAGDGRPNARMSARFARICPALFPSFPGLWVSRGE
jgi:hypothetical protein